MLSLATNEALSARIAAVTSLPMLRKWGSYAWELGRYSASLRVAVALGPRAIIEEARQQVGNVRSVEFESEEQLVKAIVSCAKRANRPDYRIELEVDAGVGIADLVLAKRAIRTTNALRSLAGITPRLAVLLSPEVCRKISSKETLAASLGTTERGTARVMSLLSTLGLVQRQGDSLFISPITVAPFGRVIAVEAKLSEWQRVIVQASRNLQFADESWVVLDHAYVRPALSQVARFKAAGVGLASIERKGGGLYVHLAAKTVGPLSEAKRWHAQAALAARIVARRGGADLLGNFEPVIPRRRRVAGLGGVAV